MQALARRVGGGPAIEAEIPQNEGERLAALYRYDVLDRPLASEVNGIVRLAALVTGATGAVVNLIDRNRQWQACAVGLEPGEGPRSEAMCSHTILQKDVLHTPDARLDKRFEDNPWVTGGLGDIRMYAAAPLITPEGLAIGTICTFDDRTFTLSQSRLDGLADLAAQLVSIFELRRHATMLATANHELDSFAGVIAHDLRNPLAAVTGYVEILQDEVQDQSDTNKQIVKQLLGTAKRMDGLIAGMLNLYRSGHSAVRSDSVRVDEAVQMAMENLDRLISERDAKVIVYATDKVRGDVVLLAQLFQNLVANAIVHTTNTSSPIVKITTSHDKAGRVVVHIDDNGPGIPEHLWEKIFEPFHRGESSAEGHGIGLATCQRIVQRHDAQLTAGQAPEGGARFTLLMTPGD